METLESVRGFLGGLCSGKLSKKVDPYVKATVLHSSGYCKTVATKPVKVYGPEVDWLQWPGCNRLDIDIPKQCIQEGKVRIRLEVYDEEFGRDAMIGITSQPMPVLAERASKQMEWVLKDQLGERSGAVLFSLSVLGLEGENNTMVRASNPEDSRLSKLIATETNGSVLGSLVEEGSELLEEGSELLEEEREDQPPSGGPASTSGPPPPTLPGTPPRTSAASGLHREDSAHLHNRALPIRPSNNPYHDLPVHDIVTDEGSVLECTLKTDFVTPEDHSNSNERRVISSPSSPSHQVTSHLNTFSQTQIPSWSSEVPHTLSDLSPIPNSHEGHQASRKSNMRKTSLLTLRTSRMGEEEGDTPEQAGSASSPKKEAGEGLASDVSEELLGAPAPRAATAELPKEEEKEQAGVQQAWHDLDLHAEAQMVASPAPKTKGVTSSITKMSNTIGNNVKQRISSLGFASPMYKRSSQAPAEQVELIRLRVDLIKGRSFKDVSDDRHLDPVFLRGAVVIIVMYFTTGTIFYSLVEGWTVIDCLYFAVVTLTTCGYGDLKPTMPGSKVFTCFFAFLGIAIITSCLGVLGGYVMEKEQRKMLEKVAVLQLDRADKQSLAAAVRAEEAAHGGPASGRRSASPGGRRRSSDTAGLPPNIFGRQGATTLIQNITTVLFYTLLITLMITGGSIYFYYEERLDAVDALYLSCISLATVGYGDLFPRSQEGRLFTTIWLVFGTVLMGKAIAGALGFVLDGRRRKQLRESMEMSPNSARLQALDENGDGEITKEEFLARMLVKLKKIDPEDVRAIMELFETLDTDKSGSLTESDLIGTALIPSNVAGTPPSDAPAIPVPARRSWTAQSTLPGAARLSSGGGPLLSAPREMSRDGQFLLDVPSTPLDKVGASRGPESADTCVHPIAAG